VQANEIEQGIRIIAKAIADAKSGLVSDEMIAAFTGW
jgi:hypothetical protein